LSKARFPRRLNGPDAWVFRLAQDVQQALSLCQPVWTDSLSQASPDEGSFPSGVRTIPPLEQIVQVMAGMIPTLRADFPPLLVQNLLIFQSNYQ